MKNLLILLSICNLYSQDAPFKFEGVFGNVVENIQNMNINASMFLPYNPIIIEIGAFEGAGTIALSLAYPYGKIFAFEPHPTSYDHLLEKTSLLKNVSIINSAISASNGIATLYGDGSSASLLPQNSKSRNNVPSVVLDNWCKEQEIDHIDFLRLDVGGLEGQIIKSSPHILKSVRVIVTKTYLAPRQRYITAYTLLKKQLENEGFEMLSHWYQKGKEGEATFVRKYLYDSLFR